VRMVLERQGEHASQWAEIDCPAETLRGLHNLGDERGLSVTWHFQCPGAGGHASHQSRAKQVSSNLVYPGSGGHPVPQAQQQRLDAPAAILRPQDINASLVAHPSHNLAKLPFEPSVVIAREAIRSRYGDGFAGAPLKLNRLPDEGRTTHRDADGAAHAGSTGTHGPGPVRSDPAE